MSHSVPARHAADCLANLQGLFDQANLLVVTPSSPTLGAQHIDLHSPCDLKARLKVKSSGRLSNYTRRPPPEGYVEGVDLHQNPTMAEIFSGWCLRDGDSTGNFSTQRFGKDRDIYNDNIDSLLFRQIVSAVERYDPNDTKPLFRSLIRDDFDKKGPLHTLVAQLPSDVYRDYASILWSREFFTTADVWALINERAHGGLTAKRIELMQGYFNQEALAKSLGIGVAGSDGGENRWRPALMRSASQTESDEPSRSADELREQAEFSLTAPAIEILATLSPAEIFALREQAQERIFDLKFRHEASELEIRNTIRSAIKEYWEIVCEHLERSHPKLALQKTSVLGFAEDYLPPAFKRAARKLSSNHVDIAVGVALSTVSMLPFVGPTVKWAGRTFGYRLLYRRTPAFRELKGLTPNLWRPSAAWVSRVGQQDDNLQR